MAKVNFTFKITLDESEFVKIEDHLYTTKTTLHREEPKVHLVSNCCLELLKEFEGQLTQHIVEEWLLLSRALDQSCSYENKWNDRIILQELVAGHDHTVSWYANNCRVN